MCPVIFERLFLRGYVSGYFWEVIFERLFLRGYVSGLQAAAAACKPDT